MVAFCNLQLSCPGCKAGVTTAPSLADIWGTATPLPAFSHRTPTPSTRSKCRRLWMEIKTAARDSGPTLDAGCSDSIFGTVDGPGRPVWGCFGRLAYASFENRVLCRFNPLPALTGGASERMSGRNRVTNPVRPTGSQPRP